MWRPPRFWNTGEAGIASTLLSPLAVVYSAAVRLRSALTSPMRAGIPVVCIGNPGLGGGGKTPTAIAVARRLQALGASPHFLTRGYGGRLAGPVTVDPSRHSAAEVGDEPLLLAAVAPTHVARDRRAGAATAVRSGASVIVLDDGYQNPSLAKDLSLLVVDGAAGIGNGRVFPAGPLREPITDQLARAAALVVIGEGAPGAAVARLAERAGVEVLRAHLAPAPDAPDLTGRAVFAFCGIARPEKFFETLESLGARIVDRLPFADHHAFTARDAASILETVSGHVGAVPVTTEKDFVRLGSHNDPDGALRRAALTLPIEVVFDNQRRLDALLQSALEKAR